MRKLIGFLGIAWCFLDCATGFAQMRICPDEGPCKTFASQEEAVRYLREQAKAGEARARDIMLHMPIDYRDCILPALLDEMLPLRGRNLYVSRMDKRLADKLAQYGVSTLPESAFPRKLRELQNQTPHSAYYDFAFGFLAVLKPNEEWEAGVGFHCGTLCLSRTRYVLKRVGTTCSIVSKEWAGGA